VARPDLAIEKRESRPHLPPLHEQLIPCLMTSRSGPGTSAAPPAGAPASTTNRTSTIGFEARPQPGVSFDSESEFVEDAVATLGAPPPKREHIVALNRAR